MRRLQKTIYRADNRPELGRKVSKKETPTNLSADNGPELGLGWAATTRLIDASAPTGDLVAAKRQADTDAPSSDSESKLSPAQVVWIPTVERIRRTRF
jgi:hypothetical protein